MFSRIWSNGTCPGPSTITCTSFSQARCVSSPRVSSSANCAASLASAVAPGPQAVAQGERDVVFAKISQSSSKWVYRKFSWWWARHQPAMMAPPRDTMPVTRLAVSGT